MAKTVPKTASTGSEAADGPTGQAQQKAQEVASQAQDKAREAAGQARGRIGEQVDQRSTQIGDQVNSNAGDARSVAEELRSQGKETPARYVDQAADRAERLGGYLQNSDGDQILRDVEDFGRRNPWAVAAGGLLLGFAASRLLKASSSQRYQSSQSDFANRGTGVSAGSAEDYGSERFGRETLGEGYATRPGEFEPRV